MSDTSDPPELYSLRMEDRGVVKILIEAVRVILGRSDIGPHTVHMCGVALHALERLPLVTKNVGFTLMLTYRYENGNREGLDLRIDSDSVELGRFGWVYTDGVGPDGWSDTLLSAGLGAREVNTHPDGVQEWAISFRQCAAEHQIDFDDFGDSAPNWFDDDHDPELYWDQLDSDCV